MIGSQAAISTYYRYSRLIMELLIDHGKVFFRDVPCRCSRAVVGAPVRSRLLVELDTHRHLWQLPSRRALPWYPLEAPRNDKVYQCSNGSVLESSTASSNGSASGNESTQENAVLIQCMFHITRAHAQLVVLDIGQPELQYRRCSCARSWETMEYHCNTPTTNNMTRY